MELSNLRPADGSKHSKYRKGRGHASGNGKTAGYQRTEGTFRSSQTGIRRRPDASVQKTPQERLQMLQ